MSEMVPKQQAVQRVGDWQDAAYNLRLAFHAVEAAAEGPEFDADELIPAVMELADKLCWLESRLRSAQRWLGLPTELDLETLAALVRGAGPPQTPTGG